MVNFFGEHTIAFGFTPQVLYFFLVEHEFTPGFSTILSRQNTLQVKGNKPSQAP
jgi:hypothetical protein